ncbi:MAG: glutamyl-tRNA reductase [Chloroflexi bacterium]|nr:glutamyl-tRNA reductase [Chloroflexota bacterium]
MKQENSVVFCVGINHLTSPVEEREKLSFSSQELPAALGCLKHRLQGVILLSTCNRTELYTVAASGDKSGRNLISLLNAAKGASVIDDHFYVLQSNDAVRHLFRVASSIDSMVIGESQILGQVRDAFSAADEADTIDGILLKLFHSAIGVGRRARSETHIGRHAVSVSSAAVTLARNALGDLTGKTVLVVSAGGMGELAAKSLADHTGSRIIVANRTLERAQELAEDLGGEVDAITLSDLPDALAVSDIVISGTSADRFIIGPDDVRPVMERRNGRGLLFIDIAVPRDIDPAVAELSGVHLHDIDDIEAVTNEGWNGRLAEVGKVEAIVDAEVESFFDWWRSLDVVPVVAALRERAESIRRAELERTLKRMPNLDDESRKRLESMTSAIVKKMLDRPISRLKDGTDTGLYMEALQDLFDIHPDGRR